MQQPIGVGIVGYGRAGRWFHAQLIAREPRFKIAAVATRSEERQKQAQSDYPGVAVHSTLEQMLEDRGVQLVVIATPHDTHAELAVKAAEAGRHVVVDKVMCLTVSEADRMIRAARENGVLLSVFHNRRWDGDFLTIRKVVEAGLLGRLRVAEIGIWGYGPSRGWRAERSKMGGLLFDWGAHLVDQAILLQGEPPVCLKASSQFDRPEIDVETFARCELTFSDGALYLIEVCKIARIGKPHWFLVGERGSLVKYGVDPQEPLLLSGKFGEAKDPPEAYARISMELGGIEVEMRLETARGDWLSFYRNIADVLMEGAELAVKPEEIRRVVAVLEGSAKSAAEGRVVQLQSDGTYG